MALAQLPPGQGIRAKDERARYKACHWKLSKAERFAFEGPGLLMVSAEVVGQDLGMGGSDVVRLLDWAGFGVIQIGRRVLVNRRQVELLLFALTWGGLLRRKNPKTGKRENYQAFQWKKGLDGEFLETFRSHFAVYCGLMNTMGKAYRRLLRGGKWKNVEESFQDLLKIPLEQREKHQAIIVRMFRELGLNPDYAGAAGEEATRIEYEAYSNPKPPAEQGGPPMAVQTRAVEAKVEADLVAEGSVHALDMEAVETQNVPDGVDGVVFDRMRRTLGRLEKGFDDPEHLYEQKEESPGKPGRGRRRGRPVGTGSDGGLGRDGGDDGGESGPWTGGEDPGIGPAAPDADEGREEDGGEYADFGDETGADEAPAHRPPSAGSRRGGIATGPAG